MKMKCKACGAPDGSIQGRVEARAIYSERADRVTMRTVFEHICEWCAAVLHRAKIGERV